MRFALLGQADEFMAVLRAIAQSDRHQFVALADAASDEPAVRDMFPLAEVISWDGLLHHPLVDVILVDSRPFDPARDEVLRRLVQSGATLVLTHPATTHLLALELEMIRVDADGVILTYLPHALKPLPVQEPLHQVVWQRSIPDQARRDDVWRMLARDLLQARRWMGPFQQVTAMTPTVSSAMGVDHGQAADQPANVAESGVAESAIAESAVQKCSDEQAAADWTAAAGRPPNAPGRPPAVAGRRGADGRHQAAGSWTELSVLAKCEQGGLLRWSAVARSDNDGVTVVRWSSGAARGQLRADVDGLWSVDAPLTDRSPAHAPQLSVEMGAAEQIDAWESELHGHAPTVAWEAACQSLVMMDGVEYSLVRGRPVNLRNDLVTEEDSFKGVMAATGCLLLFAVVALLFLITIIDGLQLPIRNAPLWQQWPTLVVIPLVAFLALQVLKPLVYRNKHRQHDSDADGDRGGSSDQNDSVATRH